jgi:serine protein kinase
MLARFSVLSRLRNHENSTLFAKMRAYDGESLRETDPKARSVQEYRDAAGMDEGMDGISTRFAFKVLAATFNHDTIELGADPVHLMYVLEQAIRREQLPDETEKRYLEFIKAELAPRYAEFIGHEVQKAYLESYRTTVRTCSTAMSTTPTPGSRTRISRIRTPASSSTANCSTRS